MAMSTFTIVRCSEAQKLQTRKNHFVQWGQPLGFTEDGWLDRFASLERGRWAEDDRYVTWALVPRDNPDTLDLLAHCETFRRKAMLSNGTAKEVISYGIASVYTPAQQRGKGYARHILQLIHYLIAPGDLLPPFPDAWGPKPDIGPMDGQFSILFSGIGDKYYATCKQGDGHAAKDGWIRQPVTSRTWDVSSYSVGSLDQKGWEWLGADKLKDLEDEAGDQMKKDISEQHMEIDKHSFLVLPSWSLLEIHAKRSEVSPASRARPGRPYALRLPASTPGPDRPFVTFTYPEGVSDDPALRITYLHHSIPFEAIVVAAQKAGCSQVSMWGDRAGWDDHKPSMDAESEMPCYVVYGQDTEQCIWLTPELYTWC